MRHRKLIHLQYIINARDEGATVYAYEVPGPSFDKTNYKSIAFEDFECRSWTAEQRLVHYERLMLKYGKLMDELRQELRNV